MSGGNEVVVMMSRRSPGEVRPARYKVLAANETSKMQRELDAMGAFGFRYRGQSIAETSFGGLQAVVILERDTAYRDAQYDYQLVAATPASAMQAELNELSSIGFEVDGLTFSKTAFGGNEVRYDSIQASRAGRRRLRVKARDKTAMTSLCQLALPNVRSRQAARASS